MRPVRLVSLVSRSDLNAAIGRVHAFDEERGRYAVTFETLQGDADVHVKPENVREVVSGDSSPDGGSAAGNRVVTSPGDRIQETVKLAAPMVFSNRFVEMGDSPQPLIKLHTRLRPTMLQARCDVWRQYLRRNLCFQCAVPPQARVEGARGASFIKAAPSASASESWWESLVACGCEWKGHIVQRSYGGFMAGHGLWCVERRAREGNLRLEVHNMAQKGLFLQLSVTRCWCGEVKSASKEQTPRSGHST